MGKMAVIIGHIGQKLDESFKRKIDKAIKLAIDNYEVTDFYFKNEDDGEKEDSKTLEKLLIDYQISNEFIAQKIKEYKEQNNILDLKTTIIVGRVIDKNFNENLYDDIIQGYAIYHSELDSEEDCEAYSIRDSYIANNLDYVFWCSNRILLRDNSITRCFEPNDKKIIIL